MKSETKLAENKYDLIVAVEHACIKFNHFDEYEHLAEIDNGASETLFSQLEREISSDKVSDYYVELLVSGLEMVHRCSSKFVKVSVRSVGSDRALRLLCEVVEKYLLFPHYHAHAPTIICFVAKLFNHFTKASSIKQKMTTDNRIISSMARVLKSDMEDSVKIEAIKLLSNLVYCCSIAIHAEGIIDSLVESVHSPNTSIKEASVRTFLNLAISMENRQILGWRNDTISVLLTCLSIDNSDATRIYAIGALGNISACDENKLRLVNYGNGELVKILLFLINSERNMNFQKDSIGVLANLTNADTSCLICQYPDFMNTLVNLATYGDHEDTQTSALKVLRRLSSFIDSSMSCHSHLLLAFLKALACKKSTIQVVAALKDQSSKPLNRNSMAQFPGIMDALGDASLEIEDEGKSNAIKALLFISYLNDGSTYKVSETVLRALTAAAGLTKTKDILTRFAAIKTIKKLASREENRKMMESDGALINALKWTAKKTTTIVTITDSLTELLSASPDDMLGTLMEHIAEKKERVVSDEVLLALADATLLMIAPGPVEDQ
mmetsp:Transcript_13863/g.27640  ORF Transcript_13863/g.27640 Transcript_13863/m.27640 type:complete len:553 (-) Transcript_13863:69-1727(-)